MNSDVATVSASRETAALIASRAQHTYGVEHSEVRGAAEPNAEAMDASDRWVAAGCDPRDPPPAEEWAPLIRSFAAVVEAVHRPRADPTVTASL